MSEKRRYGLFTEQQRNYLAGELDDLTSDNERRIKGDIRERVNTLYRELCLLRNVTDDERKKIFENALHGEEDPSVKAGESSEGEMKRKQDPWESAGGDFKRPGFNNFVQFTYLGLREQGALPDSVGVTIEAAVKQAESQLSQGDVEVDLQIEFPSVNVQEAVERLESGEELRPEEMKTLVDLGYADIQRTQNE